MQIYSIFNHLHTHLSFLHQSNVAELANTLCDPENTFRDPENTFRDPENTFRDPENNFRDPESVAAATVWRMFFCVSTTFLIAAGCCTDEVYILHLQKIKSSNI
jgi:hypothetical protein